jgi:hypothetical protein
MTQATVRTQKDDFMPFTGWDEPASLINETTRDRLFPFAYPVNAD